VAGWAQAVLDYKWESYGNRLFIVFGGASVLLAIMFSAYTYSRHELTGLSLVLFRACLGAILLPLVIQEAVQVSTMLREGRSKLALATYLGNPWNVADALTYSGLVGVLALHSLLPGDTTVANILAAGVSLLLWLKLLYYFRGEARQLLLWLLSSALAGRTCLPTSAALVCLH
jgi:hypothetical protein